MGSNHMTCKTCSNVIAISLVAGPALSSSPKHGLQDEPATLISVDIEVMSSLFLTWTLAC
jgi:hypothetical protein